MKQELITKKEKLPDGWKWVNLNEISNKITDGTHKTPNYTTGGIKFISIANLKPFRPIDFDSYIRFISEEEHKELIKRCCPEYDDILIPKIGTLGFAKRIDIDEKFSIFVGLALIKPKKEIVLPKYLEYYLNSHSISKISKENAQGGGRHTLPLIALKDFPVLLPPIPIQQKIVSKLDRQMTQIGMMKREAEKELYSIKELIPSSLQKVFHIKVPLKSNKSQKTSNPPNEWKWIKLIDIAKLESGHTPRKTIDSYWVGGDVPWISLQDIKNFEGDYINDTIDHPTMEGIKNSSARILPKDTVVLSRDASIGHVIIMKRDMATTQHFVNYICSDKIKSLFLLYLLRASKIEFDRLKEGAIIKTLYMPLIKSFEIMLPPLNVQDEIIVRMKKIYEYQKILQTESENKLNAISQLPSSILNEVFGQYEIPEEV